ncbi:MAG: ZIP family zinc transporter [Actinobacteria bacterium]|nr:ZIP family zinc transporter [Actinomycetota bacterium]
MAAAAFWSLVGAGSLLLGSIVALRWHMSERAIGLIMAFGAGTLISAVAFELTIDAYKEGGRLPSLLGLVSGALVFWGLDELLERRSARNGGIDVGEAEAAVGATATGVSGPSLVLGALLDGVPESVAIAITLLGGGTVGFAMVTAVFLSNIPEGLAATVGLVESKMEAARIIGIWLIVIAISVAAATFGYVLLGSASGASLAFIQTFAAGAILTMLANTMMPEAFTHGGRQVGLLTVAGFILASGLATYSA